MGFILGVMIPDTTGVNGSDEELVTSTTYDFNTALPLTITDANAQVTEIEYEDDLLRPTKVIAPNGHETITEYGAGTSASTRFVKVKTQIDESKWKEGYSWFDGLGRNIKTQSVDSNGDVFVETEYDNMSRPKKATNPYRTGDTKLWTESFYDDLSRVTKIKTPDDAEVETSYSLATTGSQIGTTVTVEDQAGKLRRSITNALGQLKRVDEPNSSNQLGTISSPNQDTVYNYDTLSNLITVSQGSQTRSFVYDNLSRLKSATNPESGTISYIYDANGNLSEKEDAREITTEYTYDALNRVKLREYSDSTPAVSYYYDGIYYNAQNQPQQATGSVKGKLTSVSSSLSKTNYTAFDVMGRVTAHQQITDANTYPTSYIYNLSGALIEETYPSGRKVKNILDNDGDLSIVQSKKNSNYGYFNYAEHFTYTAAGAMSSMQLGNGKWESATFNNRLQPTQIALGTTQSATDLLKLDYEYGALNLGTGQVTAGTNNGNVAKQTITVPTVGSNTGFSATQYYSYDSLNRIQIASENVTPNGGSQAQSWQQTFTYDRYGNRNFDEANTTTIPKNCNNNTEVCAADRKIYNPSVNTSTNRLNTSDNYGFDDSGNTTADAQGRTFIYDAENKQIEVLNSEDETIGEYFYDGDGKRVKKSVPSTGETTIFVYDAGGQLVAEYSTQINQAPQVSYLTNDNLGTPRINTDANGQIIARHDYHPFGEETARTNYGSDDVRKKFGTYEKDNETNLDFAQARMFSSGFGRFTSPDPALVSASAENPQTWNRYTYVLNNPLRYFDPLGLWELDPNYSKTTVKDQSGKEKVTSVSVILKKEEGDDVKSLAKQFNISEKEAQKILDKMDDKGQIQLSQTEGKIGKMFSKIEDRLKSFEQFKLDNPNGGNPTDWDCSRTASFLTGFNAIEGIGVNIFDRLLGATDVDGRDVNAKSIEKDKLQTGDVLRFAKDKDSVAKHFATFLMFNKSGEPVVFSKSGEKGPFEITTSSKLSANPNYGPVTPIPNTNPNATQDKTGYYRKL